MQDGAASTTEQKQEEKKAPASLGKVQKVDLPLNNGNANGNGKAAAQEVQQPEQTAQKEESQEEVQTERKTNDTPEFTEEQLKEFFKSKNINFEGGLDTLKEKLEYVPPTQAKELTPEEISAKEIAKEKRILDLWIAQGGKPEDFYSIKKVASADVAELSLTELVRELKDEGFTDDEIAEIKQQRYYQIELDKIEQEEDESDEAFAKRKSALEKKVKYGAKKLANRSTYIKNDADRILKGLAKVIEQQDKEAEEEVLLTHKVDEHFKSLPKETVIEIGDIEGLKVDPIPRKVSETAVQKAMAILKDPQERNNFFYTEDGSLNLPNISKLLINSFEQEERDRKIYAIATDRNTKKFKEVFPYTSAQGLGVGGVIQKTDGKGKIASYGKSERVLPANT